eukprot:187643-Prymnesium_polylepis.1
MSACEVRYAFDLTLSDGKKERFVDTQLKPDIHHPFNRPEQEYHDHFADTKNYEKAWEKARNEYRRRETATLQEAKNKEEEQLVKKMQALKSKLSAECRFTELQSNNEDELKVLVKAASVLNGAKFEGGELVNISTTTSASTYKGNNCRPDDRRRTSKSKASDAITQAGMVLNREHLVLEDSEQGRAAALCVLKAIAREADFEVQQLQYSRPTRREYVVPIYNLNGWIKVADKVKDAISLFTNPSCSAQQKEWSIVRKRKREA